MNIPTEQTHSALEWLTTSAGRSVYIEPKSLAIEDAKDARVLSALRSAPSFPALTKAHHSFMRSLYGKTYSPVSSDAQPWKMLTSYAGVMNAKSTRAVTLRNLSTAVFRETGLPRLNGGTFRGSDGLDWNALTAS